MSTATAIGGLLRSLRRSRLGAAGDAELLGDFVARRDAAAFEELLRRHGPMVWGVCRRVLGNDADAEDAFQATFLILARKAASLREGATVGNWLHGVARRTALKARALNWRRRRREYDAGTQPRAEAPDPVWDQLRALLDAELSRLPDRYRIAIVLCDLEGNGIHEAARQLGCPQGTVASRLARGRDLLARRLARFAPAITATALAALLSRHASAAPVDVFRVTAETAFAYAINPALTADIVSTNVMNLTEGVLNTMFLTKCKLAAAAVAVLAIAFAGADLSRFEARAQKPATKDDKSPRDEKDKSDKSAKGEKGKGDKTEKKKAPGVSGVVKSVEGSKITISIPTGKGKSSEEKSYELSKDVKIYLADVLTKQNPLPEGKSSDLTPGTIVGAQLSEDMKTVVLIYAHGPGFTGNIKSVDAGKNMFTVAFKGPNGPEEENITLENGAKVLLNDGLKKGVEDKEGKLADLKEGTPVSVQLTVDRKRALSVRPQGRTVHGTLKAIDAGNNTITVGVKEENGPVDKTFTLAQDAHTDGDPVPGQTVRVRLSVFDDKIAVHVHGPGEKKKDK